MAGAARRQLQSYVIDFLEREGCGHQARQLEARWGVGRGPVRTANGLLLDWWAQFWRKEGLRQEAAQQSREEGGGGGGHEQQAASPAAPCHSAGGTQPCSGGAQASLSRVVQSPSPRRPPLRIDSGMTASSKQPHTSEVSGDSPPPLRCDGDGGAAAAAAAPPAAPPCASGAGAVEAAESKEALQPAAPQQRCRHQQRPRRPVSGDPIAALLARYKAAGAQRQQQRQRSPQQQQQRQRHHAQQPSPGASAAQGQQPDAAPAVAEGPVARAGPAQPAAPQPAAAAQPASQQESAGECGPGSAAAGTAPGGSLAPSAPSAALQASTAVLHGYLQLAKQQAEAQQRLYPWGRGRGQPPGRPHAAGRRRPRGASADSGSDTDGPGGRGRGSDVGGKRAPPPKRARCGARDRLPPGAYALMAQEHVRGLGAAQRAQRVQLPQYYHRRMLEEDSEDEDWSPSCEAEEEAEWEAAHQLRQRQALLWRQRKQVQRQQQPAQQAQQPPAQQQQQQPVHQLLLQRVAPVAGGAQRPLAPPGGSGAGAEAGTDLQAPAHLIQDFPDIPEDLLALDDGLDLFGAGAGMGPWELPTAPAAAAAAAAAPAAGAPAACAAAGPPAAPASASGSVLVRTASDLRGLFDDPFDTLLPLPLGPPW